MASYVPLLRSPKPNKLCRYVDLGQLVIFSLDICKLPDPDCFFPAGESIQLTNSSERDICQLEQRTSDRRNLDEEGNNGLYIIPEYIYMGRG